MSWLVTLEGSTRQLITFEGSTHVVMAPEELEQLEAALAAVTAERDELKAKNARLVAEAELELQDAEADLAGMKKLWSGYHPMCWEVSQQRVDRIKSALRGEVQP
jgi:uncharacterized membrane protein YqiK